MLYSQRTWRIYLLSPFLARSLLLSCMTCLSGRGFLYSQRTWRIYYIFTCLSGKYMNSIILNERGPTVPRTIDKQRALFLSPRDNSGVCIYVSIRARIQRELEQAQASVNPSGPAKQVEFACCPCVLITCDLRSTARHE